MSGIHAMLISGGGGAVGGSGSVTLNNATVDQQFAGGVASASWRIDSDGQIYTGFNGTYGAEYTWTTDAVANYEVQATLIDGSTPTGSSMATWLACSSDRDWTITDITANEDAKYANLEIQVRDAATATVRATCYIDLYAERIS